MVKFPVHYAGQKRGGLTNQPIKPLGRSCSGDDHIAVAWSYRFK